MIYYLGVLVLAVYISSTAALPPCVCTRDLKPVCGTDGKTYNNECLLDCARTRGASDLAVSRRGRCELPGVSNCICTLDDVPVCGSDGTTYSNACTMNCQARAKGVDIVKVRDGECRQKREVTLPDSPCICTMDYRPVCASDGNTYPNHCAMDCRARDKRIELQKVHNGECRQKREVTLPESPCICTLDYRPVCASDGNTYPNHCAMDCRARDKRIELQKVHNGACRAKRDAVKVAELPRCVCTKERKPVCGTDGHSYANRCLLRCAKQVRADLEIQHLGSCETTETVQDIPYNPACTCNRDLVPVCATNGESYPNACLMACAGAQLEREGPCDGDIRKVVIDENSS